MSWSGQYKIWHNMIRDGHASAVAEALDSVSKSDLSTPQLAQFANLAWRVGRPGWGASLLSGEVRRLKSLRSTDSSEIFLEYALCLSELGAVPEARDTLKLVENQAPKAKYYSALTYFKEWDYASAAPALEAYLASLTGDPYHQRVVRVNLASAHSILGNHTRSAELLKSVIDECGPSESLLAGNCYELLSQIPFVQGDYDEALKLLGESEKRLDSARNTGWVFCKKWQLITRMAKARKAGQFNLNDWMEEREWLRTLAIGCQSWETVRELDFFTGLYGGDQHLLEKVYFGSPFPFYRRRMLNMAEGWTPPAQFLTRESEKIIDLSELVSPVAKTPTPVVKQMLMILASDHYSPFRYGSLFAKLFPSEVFNADSSPNRIFQIIMAVRKVLKELGSKSGVFRSKFGYRLRMDSAEGWRIPRALVELESWDSLSLAHAYLKSWYGEKEFSAAQLATRLDTSKRTVNRMLKELNDRSHIQSLGKGPSAKFRLIVSS